MLSKSRTNDKEKVFKKETLNWPLRDTVEDLCATSKIVVDSKSLFDVFFKYSRDNSSKQLYIKFS